MYVKIFLNLVFIIIFSVIEFSFIVGLPFGLDNFNLILLVLVFILMAGWLDYALWWAAGAGLLMDTFSFAPFGSYMISFSLVVFAIHFIVGNFLTNRSIYSFVATAFLGTLIYEIIFYLAGYVLSVAGGNDFIFILNNIFWKNELWKIIFNIAGASVVFYIYNSLSNRFKPVFLIKK